MDFLRTVLRLNSICSRALPVNRQLYTSSKLLSNKDRARDRRDLLRGLPKRADGDHVLQDLQIESEREEYSFPDEDTPNKLFNNIPYSQLPIVHIKCSKNNTLVVLVDLKGKTLLIDSCGRNGFKNCRKGTTVAAQVTGESMGAKLLKSGYNTVRVCIKGLGPGRLECVKAVARMGVTVASVSDTTPYDEYPPRPPAAKSL